MISLLLLTASATAEYGTALGDGIETYHPVNGIVNDANLNQDGEIQSHFNQITISPTPAPGTASEEFDGTHKDATKEGDIDEQTFQTDRIHQPTTRPTAFPTKDQSSNMGSICSFGDFSKPVGWVGAGPGKYYCNVWKCDAGTTSFSKSHGFRGSQRVCSIEERSSKFCTHTTCSFERASSNPTRHVIKVLSDHREETGGHHQCGFSKHSSSRTAGRPACDCVCSGARRQDADGFERGLRYFGGLEADIGTRDIAANHDGTSDFNSYDSKYNRNNFYSQHSNLDYNENDQTYQGQRIAHPHVDT